MHLFTRMWLVALPNVYWWHKGTHQSPVNAKTNFVLTQICCVLFLHVWPGGKAFFLSAAVGISCFPPLENQPSVTSVMEPCVMRSSAVHNQIKAKIFMGVQRDWERFCQLELWWAHTDYAIIVLYEHVHAVLLQFWRDYMCVSSSPYWMLIGLECPPPTHTQPPLVVSMHELLMVHGWSRGPTDLSLMCPRVTAHLPTPQSVMHDCVNMCVRASEEGCFCLFVCFFT